MKIKSNLTIKITIIVWISHHLLTQCVLVLVVAVFSEKTGWQFAWICCNSCAENIRRWLL